MILNPPFFISSFLAPAIKIGDSTLSFTDEYVGEENRDQCEFTLQTPDFVYVDNNMRSGVGGSGTVDKFETFLSFLSACAESCNYRQRTGQRGDNQDLYPPHVAAWAVENLNDIDCTRMDICDEDGNPKHELIEE